jgi:hypothetical protein
MHSDATRTLLGRCGDDEPRIVLPGSAQRPTAFVERLKSVWSRGAEYLQVPTTSLLFSALPVLL